jgi:hypothetical protein
MQWEHSAILISIATTAGSVQKGLAIVTEKYFTLGRKAMGIKVLHTYLIRVESVKADRLGSICKIANLGGIQDF